MKPVDPIRFIPRFASALELTDEAQAKAIEIIQTTAEVGLLSGKSPAGFATTAVYSVCLLSTEKRTQCKSTR